MMRNMSHSSIDWLTSCLLFYYRVFAYGPEYRESLAKTLKTYILVMLMRMRTYMLNASFRTYY